MRFAPILSPDNPSQQRIMESKFGFKYIELTLIWRPPRSRVIKINAKNYNLKLLMFPSRPQQICCQGGGVDYEHSGLTKDLIEYYFIFHMGIQYRFSRAFSIKIISQYKLEMSVGQCSVGLKELLAATATPALPRPSDISET